MAQTSQTSPPANNINVNLTFVQEGDNVKVKNKTIENLTKIKGSEIGQVLVPDSPNEPANVPRTGNYEDNERILEQGKEVEEAIPPDVCAKGFIDPAETKQAKATNKAASRGRAGVYEDENSSVIRNKVETEKDPPKENPYEAQPSELRENRIRSTLPDNKGLKHKNGSKIWKSEPNPQAFLMEEHAGNLMKESKYMAAMEVIEKLLREWKNQAKRLKIQLMVAECNLLIGREKKANNDLCNVIKSLTSSNVPKFVDVMEVVEGYSKQGLFVRALILLRANADICKTESDPDTAILSLKQIIAKSRSIIADMVKGGDRLRLIATDFGLEMMDEILNILRDIKSTTKDLKVLEEAKCINFIGLANRSTGDLRRAAECYNKGIAIMKMHFRKDALKHRIFGFILANSGLTNADLHNYSEAESLFVKALEAKNEATDFSSEEEKADSISLTENDLQMTRTALKDIK